jgi:hypothetical protein
MEMDGLGQWVPRPGSAASSLFSQNALGSGANGNLARSGSGFGHALGRCACAAMADVALTCASCTA